MERGASSHLVNAGLLYQVSAGVWTMVERSIDVTLLRKLTRVERTELGLTAERYGRFLGMPISLAISS